MTSLPENADFYFLSSPTAQDIAIELLLPTRQRPDGIERAEELMTLAKDGRIDRRAPISVQADGQGKWRILDGNSTYAIAVKHAWRTIRCEIIEGTLSHDDPTTQTA